MIYFDNAATGGYKPPRVIEAATNAIKYMSVNAGHSGHKRAVIAEEYVYKTRKLLCDFFNADKPERVIFTKNCTEGLNTAIFGLVNKGDNVVTSVFEHNSVLRPLFFLEKKGIISLTVIKPKNNAVFKEDVENVLKKNTALVCLTGASNVTGEINDYEAIGRLLRNLNITFLLDAAQTAGHTFIDMKKHSIDVLCFSGHKGMNGIQGSGGLIFNKNVNIRPLMYGGSGTESFSPVPSGYPELLECGTMNLPAVASLFEGTIYNAQNLNLKQRRLLELTAYFIDRVSCIKGVRLFSSKNPVGIVSFAFKDYSSQEIAGVLSEHFDIAVRGGYHCAPLCHEFLGTKLNGLTRVSFNETNTEEEIDLFANSLINAEDYIYN